METTVTANTADSLLTGERTVPGVPSENYWYRRHEVAYAALGPRLAGQRLLDLGCGFGYGTAALARYAARVVGLDYDAMAMAHAASRYAGQRTGFVRGNLAALPLRAAAVDAVIALQVVEHVWDHAQFLAECARVLAPDGELILTTPNRLTFSPTANAPRNPFHTVEFSGAELCELLRRHGFTVIELAGVHAGPRLRALDARYAGSFTDVQLATSPELWPAALAADVAAVGITDFAIIGADLHGVDESLDLLVVARR